MGQPIHESRFVVIGGGVVGAAAARALARRGAEVALLERGSLLLARGSSRGSARILQPAAFPDASYLQMALRGAELWAELQEASGSRVLTSTGGLSWGEGGDGFAAALEAAGVPHELLSAAEASERFGVSIPAERIIFQPDAGVIHADAARDALLQAARQDGAELRQNERVVAIRTSEDGLELETARGLWRCETAILAAGPWTGELLEPIDVRLPLSVSAQTVAYFDDPRRGDHVPTMVEFGGEGGEPYALWDPREGIKAALHAAGPNVDPDRAPSEGDPEIVERIVEWTRARIPGLAAEPSKVEVCLYTNAPEERFILERHGRVIVGSACSGQGFQSAPETGERLATLAMQADVASGVPA
jgi:sarcosine oxidase